MSEAAKRVLFWSPRVLVILFAAFTVIFALDIFSESRGLWQTITGLLLHLVPTFLIVIVLIIAWRWELVGALVFCGLGVLYILFSLGRFPLATPLAISGPMILAGVLFLLNWIYRAQLRKQ